jgi:hypothetical protein
MQYRIECIQTVFGEERERRLKRVFDIIWNLDIKKAGAVGARSESQNSDLPIGTVPTDDIEGNLKEDENLVSDSEHKLQPKEY